MQLGHYLQVIRYFEAVPRSVRSRIPSISSTIGVSIARLSESGIFCLARGHTTLDMLHLVTPSLDMPHLVTTDAIARFLIETLKGTAHIFVALNIECKGIDCNALKLVIFLFFRRHPVSVGRG